MKKKHSYFTVEKSGKHYLKKWSRLTSPMISCTPWYTVIRSILCYSPTKPKISVWSRGKKNTRQIQIKGHSKKYLFSIHQNCQGHIKQVRLSQTRRDMTTKCNIVSWIRSGIDKGTLKKRLVKVWSWLNNPFVPALVFWKDYP